MMGFFKWIRREVDTSNSCKRRQSEPPILMNPSSSVSVSEYPRDEAYLKALSKFNEWRNKKKFSTFGRSRRKIYKKNKRGAQEDIQKSSIYDTDVTVEKENKTISNETELINIYEEIAFCDTRNSVNLLSNFEWKNYRNGSKVKMGSKSLGGKSGLITSHENEICNFEKNYCSQTVKTNLVQDNVSSPPIKFYRENSIPFDDIKSTECHTEKYCSLYSSPKKSTSRNVCKSDSKKPKRIKSCQNTFNRSYIKFDANTSLSDDCLNQSYQLIQSVKQPCFETVINKHGDLVEYILPFNKSEENLIAHPDGDNVQTEQIEFQTYVEDNFKFLQNSPTVSAQSINVASRPRHDVIVTDLDQSQETSKTSKEKQIQNDIIDDLRTLELWSQSLNVIPVETSKNKKELNISGTYFCSLKELKSRISSFRNSFKCPIIYRSGIFRTTEVSLFSFEHTEENDAVTALRKNYLILRKLRHPNVALLMAICLNKSNQIISLIMESFRYTLHDVIHKNRIVIQFEDCIEYILQIINAVQYLHECKMIHSNISSHAVLIDENKKYVKLSAFELTTNADNRNIKDEIEFYVTEASFDGTKLSKEHLPYSIEYRKMYSQHWYQAPELITTKRRFVIPTFKSDVYGLILMLWEMLNSRVPYESLNYTDFEKLIALKQIKLSWLKMKNCKLIDRLIEQGIHVEPEKRFENLNVISSCLEELKTSQTSEKGNSKVVKSSETQLRTESDSLLEFSTLLRTRNFGSDEYDRTSTVKKRKVKTSKQNRLITKGLFQNKNDDGNVIPAEKNKSETLNRNFNDSGIASNDVNATTSSKVPEIHNSNQGIQSFNEGFYLPHPQNAKHNKLLKTTWLDKDFSFNDGSKRDDNNSGGNNTVNVNIRIMHNKSLSTSPKEEFSLNGQFANKDDALELSRVDIVNQIKYWNSLTSPSIVDDTKSADHTKNHANKRRISKQNVSFGKEIDITVNSKQLKEHEQMKATVATDVDENFKEFFNKSKLNDEDFEKVLWKREKNKCEQNNLRITNDISEEGVITPERTSVRQTVHKFEHYIKCHECSSKVLNICDELKETERKLAFDNSSEQLTENNENFNSVNHVTDVNATATITTATELAENNEEYHPISISRLEIILKNDMEDQDRRMVTKEKENKAEEVFTAVEQTQEQQPLLISLKLKKLYRRASDVGCTTTVAAATSLKQQKFKNIRHSISGTAEVFKYLGQISFINADRVAETVSSKINELERQPCNNKEIKEQLQHQIKNNLNAYNVGKIKCWNCGCQIFAAVNETNNDADDSMYEHQQQIEEEIRYRPSFGGLSQDTKSVEDLYIDDDFDNDLGELCANIELGNEDRSELSDIFNFDILSAEILSKLNISS